MVGYIDDCHKVKVLLLHSWFSISGKESLQNENALVTVSNKTFQGTFVNKTSELSFKGYRNLKG
jgi:hypothetical protein